MTIELVSHHKNLFNNYSFTYDHNIDNPLFYNVYVDLLIETDTGIMYNMAYGHNTFRIRINPINVYSKYIIWKLIQ